MAECDDQETACSGDGCEEVSGDGTDEITTTETSPPADSPTSSTDAPTTSTDPQFPSTDDPTTITNAPKISTTATPTSSTDIPIMSTDAPMDDEEVLLNVGENETVFEDGAIPPIDEESSEDLQKARTPKAASISKDLRPSSASLLSDLLASLYEEERQQKAEKYK